MGQRAGEGKRVARVVVAALAEAEQMVVEQAAARVLVTKAVAATAVAAAKAVATAVAEAVVPLEAATAVDSCGRLNRSMRSHRSPRRRAGPRSTAGFVGKACRSRAKRWRSHRSHNSCQIHDTWCVTARNSKGRSPCMQRGQGSKAPRGDEND